MISKTEIAEATRRTVKAFQKRNAEENRNLSKRWMEKAYATLRKEVQNENPSMSDADIDTKVMMIWKKVMQPHDGLQKETIPCKTVNRDRKQIVRNMRNRR